MFSDCNYSVVNDSRIRDQDRYSEVRARREGQEKASMNERKAKKVQQTEDSNFVKKHYLLSIWLGWLIRSSEVNGF